MRFPPQQLALLLRLLQVDVAAPQLGVDGHLLARKRIQREAGADFGHAFGPLGDHDELHRRENDENHQSDNQIACHYEAAERINDLSRVCLEQDQPGC